MAEWASVALSGRGEYILQVYGNTTHRNQSGIWEVLLVTEVVKRYCDQCDKLIENKNPNVTTVIPRVDHEYHFCDRYCFADWYGNIRKAKIPTKKGP